MFNEHISSRFVQFSPSFMARVGGLRPNPRDSKQHLTPEDEIAQCKVCAGIWSQAKQGSRRKKLE